MSIFFSNPFKRDADGHLPENGRLLRRTTLVALALVLVFGGWLGFTGLEAKSNLEKARDSAQQVKDALLKGDINEASQRAESAVTHAQSARTATHSGLWNLAAAVPMLGGPFKSSQQMSDVVAGLATDILQPAAKAGIGLSPSKLYSNGRVDVQLLRQQAPELQKLSESAGRLDAQASTIHPSPLVPPVNSARTQLQHQTSGIATLLSNSALAAKVGPAMMGADGPRAYLMAFQTNAEARGTGGLLGGFGVLRFNNGKASVDNISSNQDLYKATADVDLGPEFKDLYGWTNTFTDVRNSNLSSHFPYAAQIWKSMFERDSGIKVDGVIALDPIALSYILAAEGPVTLPDGLVVSHDNVVELTESTAYIKFPTDQVARKKYLEEIANAVVKKLTGQVKSPGKLLDALGKAVGERRIMVWSSVPAEQKLLEQTLLGHAIPSDPAPYAEVIINNLGGNKMDYYLNREIEYAADNCHSDMRNSTITVRLKNTVSNVKDLPGYITSSEGLARGLPFKVPPGTMVTSVKLLATKGARLTSVTSNGEKISAITNTERDHPSFEVQVVIPPGQSGELSFQLSEPTAPGLARIPVQPLIDEAHPTVSVPTCP